MFSIKRNSFYKKLSFFKTIIFLLLRIGSMFFKSKKLFMNENYYMGYKTSKSDHMGYRSRSNISIIIDMLLRPCIESCTIRDSDSTSKESHSKTATEDKGEIETDDDLQTLYKGCIKK
ncbi:hypothetical protein BDC45DRAFT_553959 [Circinella umbellata]|nr:hypothetical protein BDC45DRAFT_553959 [Circinella umbellata]